MQIASQTSRSIPLATKAQREACIESARRGLRGARIPAPVCLSVWADEHFYLPQESSATAGPFKAIPLQRGVLALMACDEVEQLDIPKCARIGYTKMLLALIAYEVTERKRATGVYQPTNDDSDEFAEGEINPLLRDMPRMREELDPRADPDKQGRFNKLSYKKFKHAPLYIRGGHAPRSYRRLTLDTVIYDEIEGFEREIGDEGSPIKLGDGRISNSPFPKSVRGSTPRTAQNSLLKSEVDSAELVLRYYVPCPHCGDEIILLWSQFRFDKDGSNSDRARSAHYRCQSCEERIEYRHLKAMSESGRWGDDQGRRVKLTTYGPQLYDEDGNRIPFPKHVAMHVWIAYSPFFSWERLVYEWLEAQGDYSALKTFTNIRLGEWWEDETEKVEPNELMERREPYVRPPAKVLVISAGIDVQENRIEMEIVGHGMHKESWSLDYRVFYGDTEQRPVWDDLDAALSEVYTTEDGRRLSIRVAGLDTGYATIHCYRFKTRTSHIALHLLKGSSEIEAPLVGAPKKVRISRNDSRKVELFMAGVGVGKSTILRRLQMETPPAGEDCPGFMHFPEHYEQDYFDGLTAEKKDTKKRRGFKVVEWVKIRPRNEPLDCRNYANIALEILNPTWSALAEKAWNKKPDKEPPPDTVNARRHAQRRRRAATRNYARR